MNVHGGLKRLSAAGRRRAQRIKPYARYAFDYARDLKAPLVSYWWRERVNVGDLMGPYILESIFNRPVYHLHDLPRLEGRVNVTVTVGSIIQQIDFARPVLWGTGIIDPARVPNLQAPSFISVRGPLTREAVNQRGWQCPESYGDPALVLSRLYEPPRRRLKSTSKIGIVLHFKDRDLRDGLDDEKFSFINVSSSVEHFINQLYACELVMSSSLHGLITAQSYGIPSVWLKRVENKKGGDFKYRDYLHSFGGTIRYVDLDARPSLPDSFRNIERHILDDPPESFIDEIYSKSQRLLSA